MSVRIATKISNYTYCRQNVIANTTIIVLPASHARHCSQFLVFFVAVILTKIIAAITTTSRRPCLRTVVTCTGGRHSQYSQNRDHNFVHTLIHTHISCYCLQVQHDYPLSSIHTTVPSSSDLDDHISRPTLPLQLQQLPFSELSSCVPFPV